MNFKKRRSIIVLIFVIAVGLFLRFYDLGNVPQGFHRDEAFLGYNAYSLLTTGKDLSGKFLPLHFESFIYSPGGYSYLLIPFIFLFGLCEFSVRFASAFFGSLTVALIYFLANELIMKTAMRMYASRVGIVTSFFLAISPWHVNLSRVATENVLVVFFILAGLLCFLQWIKTEIKTFLFFSFISFIFTLFLYQAPRAFLPIFLPTLLLLFPKKSLSLRRLWLPAALFILFIVFPLILIFSSNNLSLRFRTLSIFSTTETQLMLNEKIREDGVANINRVVSRVFHNKFIGYTNTFLENYFKHFTYDFLFTQNSLPDRYRVPGVGVLYPFQLVLLVAGFIYLLRENNKLSLFLLLWILSVPIGSALTFDDIPNLQRTLLMVIPIFIICSVGLLGMIRDIGIIGKFFVVVLCIVALYNILFYFHEYYIHVNVYRPWIRQDGYRELVSQVNKIEGLYQKIIITNRESAPTIFFLFYTKYDAKKFQNETSDSKLRDFDRIPFGKYIFSQEECPLTLKKRMNYDKKTLYVNSGNCKDQEEFDIIRIIKRKDSSIAFYMVVPR